MRVLLLSRYGRLGSSSRLRYYQFLSDLASHNIDVDVAPLLPDNYLSALYAGEPRSLGLISAQYGKRFIQILKSRQYDILWIEKEALPWIPYQLESFLLSFAPPYIIDFDDAWFHIYDKHPRGWIRLLLGRKLDRLMEKAALVTVGNPYLAARALSAGAQRVETLPTVVDLERYGTTTSPRTSEGSATIGWIGSPVTAHYLDLIAASLQEICASTQARLVLVGAGNHTIPNVSAIHRPWSEDTEVDDIMGFDLGIMPLTNSVWELGKCGFKLIQYMACGKPVIASPIGINRDIVEHGVNGFLAETQEEWTNALKMLSADSELRFNMGRAGRAKIERLYSRQEVAPKIIHLLHTALSPSS